MTRAWLVHFAVAAYVASVTLFFMGFFTKYIPELMMFWVPSGALLAAAVLLGWLSGRE
jgi:hypothetical protein